jgi:hypothetical protein
MASTLRSAASVRTGASGGGRSGGQASGVVRKAAAVVTRPVRVLPKVIENNQDVTPKRLIDPEQFYTKVKESFLTQDASSTVRIFIFLEKLSNFFIDLISQVKLRIQQLNHRFSLLQSE